MFKKSEPIVLIPKQKVARYQALAESELAKAGKAGRLEMQTVHATRATALATLALSYQIMAQTSTPAAPC